MVRDQKHVETQKSLSSWRVLVVQNSPAGRHYVTGFKRGQ